MEKNNKDWRLEKKVFAQKGKHLLQSSLWSDCSFVVGKGGAKKEFKAHRLFLAMASPVFEAMFYGPMAEKCDIVSVEDVSAAGFNLLLEYIYTDAVNITTFSDARDVCYAAKKYLMPDLEKICTNKLREFLSPATACFAYEFAKFIGDAALADEAMKVISLSTTEVLADPGFGEVQLSTLDAILDMQELAISSEVQIFDAVLQWATAECARKGLEGTEQNLRAAVRPALRKVRFLTLQPQQLAQGPAASALLTRDESFALFMHVSAPDTCKFPLPQGFSASREARRNIRTMNIKNIRTVSRSETYDRKSITISFEGNGRTLIVGVQIENPTSRQVPVKMTMWEVSKPQNGRLLIAEVTRHFPSRQQQNLPVMSFASSVPIQINKTYEITVDIQLQGLGLQGLQGYRFPVNSSAFSYNENNNIKIFSINDNHQIKSIVGQLL